MLIKKKEKNGINRRPIYPLIHFFRKKEKFGNLWGKRGKWSAKERRKKGRRDSVGNEDG